MTAQEIRGGLQVDPFHTRAWRSEATGEWVVEWHAPGDTAEQVGVAAFLETDDGIEWTRFYVRENFRGNGIYTQALKWSMGLGVEVTASSAGTLAEDWDGFKDAKEGGLKLDRRVAKARVKVG